MDDWSDLTVGWLTLSHVGPPPEDQLGEVLVNIGLDIRGMANPAVGIKCTFFCHHSTIRITVSDHLITTALTQPFIDTYLEAVDYARQIFSRSSGRTAFRWAFLGAFTQAIDDFVNIVCQECEVARPWEAWPSLIIPDDVRRPEYAIYHKRVWNLI